MKAIILISLLLIPMVYAECNETDIYNRVRSDCKLDNGICDDGENFLLDADCKLDKDILSAVWLVRLFLLVALFMLITKNKYFVLVLLIIAVLVVYNMPTIEPEPIQETKACQWDDYLSNPGKCLWPSNPIVGWVIIGIIAVFIWKKFFSI